MNTTVHEHPAPTLEDSRNLVDTLITHYLDELALEPTLDQATRYAVLSPGKRTRPHLVLLAAHAAGGHPDDAAAPAAATELVHAFSLVHDDLPALDNDDLRRGRPTTHKAFGEAMAILVGDALLAIAFRILAERVPNPATVGNLTRELALGASKMVNGQVLDTLADSTQRAKQDPHAALRAIHLDKTGALIRAACRMGALAANLDAHDPITAALTHFGQDLGLLFQVTDDLIDATGDTHHVGKQTNKDADAGKLTYPGLLGLDETRTEVQRLERSAIAHLQPIGPTADPLRDLTRRLAVRTH